MKNLFSNDDLGVLSVMATQIAFSLETSHDEALGALHESNFAERDQGFGACAGVADHYGACGRDRSEHDVRSTAADGIIDEQAHVQGHVGVAIQGGIIKRAKGGDAVLTAGDLAIQHVEEAGKENNQRAGEEVADREHTRGHEIDHESEECKEIRVHACGGERSDNFVRSYPAKAPLLAGMDDTQESARRSCANSVCAA